MDIMDTWLNDRQEGIQPVKNLVLENSYETKSYLELSPEK